MTVTIMGVTMALMGSVPTYESIGIMSPILLVTLRAIQGVALGGEWAGAVLISVEHGAQDKRGRNASFTQVGPALGTLLASGCIALITYLLTPDAFLSAAGESRFCPASFCLVLVCGSVSAWTKRPCSSSWRIAVRKQKHRSPTC